MLAIRVEIFFCRKFINLIPLELVQNFFLLDNQWNIKRANEELLKVDEVGEQSMLSEAVQRGRLNISIAIERRRF